jgi:XTP/dITP diphosphohydrolase/tetrapyrrole methylase family protein/MazG family protein/ATP diphosphatase
MENATKIQEVTTRVDSKLENTGSSFQELAEVMRKLRSPGGCPWDREQTFETLRTYIIEESYELVEAITNENISEILEECGDLLLQPVFVSAIAEEKGLFSLADVIDTLREKLVRRHPHVFGDVSVRNSDDVLKNWENIKTDEKMNDRKKYKDGSVLSGVPGSLPALVKAYRMQEKAANVGFDWPKGNMDPLFGKVEEEIGELKEALYNESPVAREEELGDLFFAMVNLARHLDIDPEVSLHKACSKFEKRFRSVEGQVGASGKKWSEFTLEELDSFWDSAKRETSEQNSR